MKDSRQMLLERILNTGLYRANKSGEVFSCRKRGRYLPTKTWAPLTKTIMRLGYQSVAFCLDKTPHRFLVHSVVWIAHKGLIPKGYEINHRDGNKANNNLANLELVTRSQNLLHAFNLGLCKRGELSSSAKLTEEKVKEIRRLAKVSKLSWRALARQFKVSHTAVQEILKNTSWKHVV